MKSYLFIGIAMLTAAGAVALTKPNKTIMKRAPRDVFLRFKGTTQPLSASELTDPSQWEFLGINPGTDCGGLQLPCVVSIDSVILNNQQGASKEDKMAKFMDSQSDDGVTYATGSNEIYAKD